MASGAGYSAEVLQAATHRYSRQIDGYGEHIQDYLLCLLRETHRGSVYYVITCWNASQEQAAVHYDGTTRYLTRSLDEAEEYYRKVLYPKRTAA